MSIANNPQLDDAAKELAGKYDALHLAKQLLLTMMQLKGYEGMHGPPKEAGTKPPTGFFNYHGNPEPKQPASGPGCSVCGHMNCRCA